MNIDAPILRKALEHITAHPEEWDQSQWAGRDSLCGTSCCLAGMIAVQQGYKLDFEAGDSATSYAIKDGRSNYISHVAAAELLGCEVESVAYGQLAEYPPIREMFRGSHELPDLWRMASQLTDGEIKVPEEFL